MSLQHLEQARQDQGVQMSFEEPEFDKASSMIKEEPQRFLSHQASSLSSVRGFDQPEEEAEETLEPVPFLSPQQQNHAQPDYSSNNSMEQPSRKELDQIKLFEEMKLKYQKQLMQEYTQMMQQMSKDMFDASFLKNF